MNKRFIFIIACFFSLIVFPVHAQFVTHSFKYQLEVTEEVFFVWGGKGWEVSPYELRPPGTFLRNGVMHSPMTRDGKYYSINIIVQENAVINYGFSIKIKTAASLDDYIWEGEFQTKAKEAVSKILPRKATLDQLKKVINPQESGIASEDSILITTVIKYYFPKATEVDLVWGINGWNTLPEALRPKGAFIKNKLMRIPMTNINDTFVTTLTLPKEAILNYGYLINKIKFSSEACEFWDEKENAPVIQENFEIMDNPSEKAIKYVNQPQSFPNIAENPFYILLAFILFFFIANSLKGYPLKDFNQRSFTFPGIAWAVALSFFLILIRANTAGLKYHADLSFLSLTGDVITASFYDAIYIILIYALFHLLFVLAKNKMLLSKIIYGSFIFLCFFSLIASVLNIKAVEMLGTPFNYKWLYYSDFLGSVDARNALTSNLNLEMIINIIALCTSLYILKEILQSVLERLFTFKYGRVFSYTFSAVLVAIYTFSFIKAGKTFNDPGKLQNPVVAFIVSVIDSNFNPDILTTAVTKEYFEEFDKNKNSCPRKTDSSRIKNVVLFVMESVSSKYVDMYTSNYHATPVLSSYFNQSLIFENAYAHAPSTNISMVSILAGIYPWISYKSITKEHPDIKHPTISSELKKQGFRTSFFTSADNGFQNVGEYLSLRDFDAIGDFKNGDCASKQLIVKEEPWENSDGADDECIVNDFKKWVSEDHSKPFFSVLWTYQTHYPYFLTVKKELDYVHNSEFNRYLNALNHTDAVIGKLLKFLEEKNMMDSTLVVIVADHGEAFGQHGQTGHASELYEENVHVPLIFINPVLFKGERNPVIAGHIDLAPTIFSMLQIPPPSTWQGECLLDESKTPRTYFYAPWSDFLFGYRDRNIKFIYNATRNSHEAYDLTSDPHEKKNSIPGRKDYEQEGQQRLASWVQYHDQYMRQMLQVKK